MSWGKTILAGAILLSASGLAAASNLNEVGALLVYPYVAVFTGQETYVTITNAGQNDVTAHIAYINGSSGPPGQPNPDYCKECNFGIDLTPGDTEVLVLTKNEAGLTDIAVRDVAPGAAGQSILTCPWVIGMLVVALEDGNEKTISDNVLLGEEIVVDYEAGYAFSIPAIPFQGGTNSGDRIYSFNDDEYDKLPRYVATDFFPPSPSVIGPVTAELAVFTLDFLRGSPPATDCSVTGYDAFENPFSAGFQFGCWDLVGLSEISPEFVYPYLGVDGVEPDHHGWLSLDCRVDRNPNESDGFDTFGGVHGAIIQKFMPLFGANQPPFDEPPAAATSWGRPFYQSVSTGSPVTLEIGGPVGDPGYP